MLRFEWMQSLWRHDGDYICVDYGTMFIVQVDAWLRVVESRQVVYYKIQ